MAGRVPTVRISKDRLYEHGYRSKFMKQSTPMMRHLPPHALTLPPRDLQNGHMSISSQLSQCFSHSTPFAEQGKYLPPLVVILILP